MVVPTVTPSSLSRSSVIYEGVTYFSDINSRSSAGKFLKVPLLIGSNAQEGDLFVVALEQLELGGTIPGLTQQGSDDVTEVRYFKFMEK